MNPEALREQFLLDPEVAFLNHGSFGATPRSVMVAYQSWQNRLERQPVLFLGREFGAHMARARADLAAGVGCAADDLVFVPNATTGVNIVARSLSLAPDDEIVVTDHAYGACLKAWEFVSQRTGARLATAPIALDADDDRPVIEQLWRAVTPRTRVIFISHITSATAQTFPIAAICRRARAEGIMTVVDGAHVPGQRALNIAALGADCYTGNCHKWMMAPKGAGFLYVRREVQPQIEPLVVSWGWGEAAELDFGSPFVTRLQWCGTHDPAAYLAVSAAAAFAAEWDWAAVRRACHARLRDALARVAALTGMAPVYRSADAYEQMALARLPDTVAPRALQQQLYDAFKVEIPVTVWRGAPYVRISVQGYNTDQDIDRLITALRHTLTTA